MKKVKLFEEFLTELNETTISGFKPVVLDRKNSLDVKLFKKLMPRTAGTTEEAMERIWMFEDSTMFAHYQYHIVRPHGNRPDRPTYRIHQSQYWLNDTYKTQIQNLGLDPSEGVNTTLVTIFKLKDGEEWNRRYSTSEGDAYEDIGKIWVNTKAFLDELNRVFEVLNRTS